MLGILKTAVKAEIKLIGRRYRPEDLQYYLNQRNEFIPLGQLQRITDRLNEIHLFYDNQIKEELKNANRKL